MGQWTDYCLGDYCIMFVFYVYILYFVIFLFQVVVQLSQNGEFFVYFSIFCYFVILLCLNVCLLLCLRAGFLCPISKLC